MDDGPAPSRRSTADGVLDVLVAHGVRTAFGLPGVHVLALWQAAQGGRLGIVGVRHEQTAGYAADGLARATGGLGVAVTTSGPGAANAVAAFGEAAASGSPVVLIASDVPAGLRLEGAVRGLLHESRDQAALFEPLAKAVYRPMTPVAAVEAVDRACRTALAWPRGPVYVGIPSDVLTGALPESWLPRAPDPPERLTPPQAEIDAALSLLAAAERVAVWVGGGAVQSDAGYAVAELAWRLGAPVVTTYGARGLLPTGHPLLVDAPPHEPAVAAVLADADLLLTVGSDLDGMDTMNWALPLPERMVAVTVDPADATKNRPADVVVRGDARLACDALAVRVRTRLPWADSVFRVGADVRAALAADPATAEAAALVQAVATWPERGTIVCDMAVAGYWVGGYAPMTRPRRLQYPVGWGTLGSALPAAIGAAHNGGPVLAVVGDGGLAMALGELGTLVQERLNVTVLLVDDAGYGMLRYDQATSGRPPLGSDLVGPDWAIVAEAYGISVSEPVDSGAGLRVALAEAAASPGPHLVVLGVALLPPRTTSPRWSTS